MSSTPDDLLPINLIFTSPIPDLDEIINSLNDSGGRDFETAVCNSMKYLDLEASLTETTEAESDVIVEALHAEAPFFIVVECQAVLEGNQVGYSKLGQIRGNAASYLDTRRQQLFENYYKLVVGKPEFSEPAKERAAPDVGLMSANTLVRLMRLHEKYRLSQNVLQEIFKGIGEITVDSVDSQVRGYLKQEGYARRLEIYSLIYAALLQDPFADKTEQRKTWTPADQIAAEVLTYGKMFRIRDLDPREILLLIRDLDNPFMRVVESRGNMIRLATVSQDVIARFCPLGEDMIMRVRRNLEKLRTLRV